MPESEGSEGEKEMRGGEGRGGDRGVGRGKGSEGSEGEATEIKGHKREKHAPYI